MRGEPEQEPTDEEIKRDRARRRAAQYERDKGREENARRIEAGRADESAIVETMLWLDGAIMLPGF
jgi:hypothetical protein